MGVDRRRAVTDQFTESDKPQLARFHVDGFGEHANREERLRGQIEQWQEGQARSRGRAGGPHPPRERAPLPYESARDRYLDHMLMPYRERADAFRGEIARYLPARRENNPTTGLLDAHRDEAAEIRSGSSCDARYKQYVDRLRDPGTGELPQHLGFTERKAHHVEARVAALMRAEGIVRATLYLNHAPCREPRRRDGCAQTLPRLLPEGAKLTVYGPRERGQEQPFRAVYTGRPDEPAEDRSR